MQLSFEFTKDRIEQVIRFQLCSIPNRLDGFDAGTRAVHLRDRHGTIQGDHWRIVHLGPLIIQRQYSWPIRRLIVLGHTMTSGDTGLHMIFAEFRSGAA